MRLHIVCENTVGRPIAALGEHGFACHLETEQGAWLFDTGRGEALLPNMQALGLDPLRLDGIVLSHGHNDHAGGLKGLLDKVGPLDIFAHPEIFRRRYWQGQHEKRDISLPFEQDDLVRSGGQFRWLSEFAEIADGLYFSGRIPRENRLEKGDPHLVCERQGEEVLSPDTFPDDAALVVSSPRGLVILLGCAHAGLINTVSHIQAHLPGERIHAIIGGTHLGPAGDDQFKATLDYLDRLEFDRLGLSHCTGQIRAAQLHARFPNKVFFASVGTIVEA